MHRFLSIVDALEVVEAKSEPSSMTMMLELNEVDATTEPVSSFREQTMDIEELCELYCIA